MKTHSKKLLKALEVALVARSKKEVVKLEVLKENLVSARWIGVNERLIALFNERISSEDFKLVEKADLVTVYRQNERSYEFVFAEPDQIAQEASFDALKERQDLFYVQVFGGGKYKTRKRTYSLTQFLNQKEYRRAVLEWNKGADIIDEDVVRQVFSHYFDVLDVDTPLYYETYIQSGDYFVYKTDESYIPIRILVAKPNGELNLVYYFYEKLIPRRLAGVYYEDAKYYLFADVKKDKGYADLYLLTKKQVLKLMNKVRYMVRSGKIEKPADIHRISTKPYRIEHIALVGAEKVFRLDLKTKTVKAYEAQ